MLGTPTQKVARLANWLCRNSGYIGKYIATSSKTPIELQVPWFSWPSIDFLDEHIDRRMSIFEYGSGGSTLFFSKRGRFVRSVEDSQMWFDIMKDRLALAGGGTVDYVYAEAGTGLGEKYRQTDYVKSLNEKFDLIIVDGTEDWPSEIVRPYCFQHAESFVNEGGMIVVDDAWRYDNYIRGSLAKDIRRFVGVGPGRYGVTRTDIYFY